MSKPFAWALLNKNGQPIDLIDELDDEDLKGEFADYIPLYTLKQLSDEEIRDIGYKFGEMGVNIQMIRAIIKEITR